MNHITLTISDIDRLNSIKTRLANRRQLTNREQEYLSEFLDQVPTPEVELLKAVPFNESIIKI